jgi:hypothetical protein
MACHREIMVTQRRVHPALFLGRSEWHFGSPAMDANPTKHPSGRADRVLSWKTANDLVGIVSVTYTSTAMESANER